MAMPRAPTSNQSASVLQSTDHAANQIHKRTYQACIPCRRRKVRCDLGPVDDPHEPPCVRCRRESKDCHFSATRRKRKADGEGSEGDEDQITDDYAARNARKSAKRDTSIVDAGSDLQHHQTSGSFSANSPLDGYDLDEHDPYQQSSPYTAAGALRRSEEAEAQEVTNEAAAALFQSPINIPGDALHLLLKASGESEDMQRRETANNAKCSAPRSAEDSVSTRGHGRFGKPESLSAQSRQQDFSNIDPAIAGNKAQHGRNPIPKDTLNVWLRLRFVRAGWFTAREGIMYMDYFYEFINVLTPISLPKIGSYADHLLLLRDEPMLTITMLTIASRYMKLSGPGGQTRSFMIHERLWTYLQGMITCMFWGQEQFGGGFCGAGTRRLGQTNAVKGGLRTLGTIESLLLLNEFHPRSMHFPPRDDDDEILAPDKNASGNNSKQGVLSDDSLTDRDPTIANWSEPALRSDRICWSLIGLSYVLAYELGIFGTYSDGIRSADGRVKREGGPADYSIRADRIERLLYVFVVQAAGRFGLPSMYADDVNRFTLASLHDVSLRAGSFLKPEPVDETQLLWVELMVIMKTCNDQLFTTKDQTATLIQSGGYVQCLQELQPLLHAWYRRFENLEVPKHARCIIAIEYHYISLYINSLALQAVLEQWASKVAALPQEEGPASPSSSISSAFAGLYSRNEQYIKEVIDSSRIVLRHVVVGLLPDDQLKHAPVRTYFRIISAAMFLLKTFALGGKQDEVAISLRLLDDTVRALRTSVVDDVHLCLRIADLLERLTKSVRGQFVRLPPRSHTSPEQARRTTGYNDFDNNKAPTYTNPPDRFQYRAGDAFQNPLAGISRTYNNLHDSNISIMPPIGNTYAPNPNHNPNNTPYTFTNPTPYSPSNQQQQQDSPQQPLQQYAMSNNNSNDYMPSEEDWLTLDLNPLLDTSGLIGGDNQWFGAFGPETHNNLDVLGKLVNDQYRGDEYGDGGMGF